MNKNTIISGRLKGMDLVARTIEIDAVVENFTVHFEDIHTHDISKCFGKQVHAEIQGNKLFQIKTQH